jgi:hypothetical protein
MMTSVGYRRCRKIVEMLLQNDHLPDDIVKWDEVKSLIEREIADDPRTVTLYRNRLKKWGFLTEVRRALFRINCLDRYGNPVTIQQELKTEEIIKRAFNGNPQ